MNNLPNWQIERMVDLKLQEINREIEHDLLIKEAGIARKNWLARAVDALRSLLTTRRVGAQDHASIEQQSYQSLND
jgi:hypothetical protein